MTNMLFTGLTVRQGTVQWISLRRTRDTFHVSDSHSFRLEAAEGFKTDPAAAEEKDHTAFSSLLKGRCGRARGKLSIGLPSEHVLLRVLDLPAADPKELRNMVDLQADKLSPFPSENTIISHEVLSTSGASSRLVVAIAQKKSVDSVGSIFRGAGILPHRLDVETLGWWRLMKDANEVPEKGHCIVIMNDIETCDIVVALDGVPLAFRSAGKTDSLTKADLCSELDYTLTTLEAQHGIEPPRVLLWHWGAEPGEFKQAITGSLGLEVQLKAFESLPPLAEGLARRGSDGEGEVDLAPADWLLAEQRLKTRNRLLLASALLLVVWLAAVAALFAGSRWQERQIRTLQARLAELDAPFKQAREIRQLLMMTEQYTNMTGAAIECMREVTLLKPADIEFSLFKYSDDKGKRVTVQGQSATANSVLDFADSLERSTMFVNTRLAGPKSAGPDKHTFTITLEVPEED